MCVLCTTIFGNSEPLLCWCQRCSTISAQAHAAHAMQRRRHTPSVLSAAFALAAFRSPANLANVHPKPRTHPAPSPWPCNSAEFAGKDAMRASSVVFLVAAALAATCAHARTLKQASKAGGVRARRSAFPAGHWRLHDDVGRRRVAVQRARHADTATLAASAAAAAAASAAAGRHALAA